MSQDNSSLEQRARELGLKIPPAKSTQLSKTEPSATPATVAVPEWIQIRINSNDSDFIVTKSADGSIARIQIKVCSVCRNSLRKCVSYGVCATPSEGKTTIWDNVNGERPKVKETLAANATSAKKAWEERLKKESAARIAPSAGGTITPVAPGFEGFGVVASRAIARGFLVHPIAPAKKFPPYLKAWQELATSDPETIAQWATQYPQANCATVAKAAKAIDGGCFFLDKDDAPRIQALYKEQCGEDYPVSFSTESRPGHEQEAWKHTEYSRKMLDNITQGDTLDKMMSVRYNDEYVISEGSVHPDTGLPYQIKNDSPVNPAPDKLVDFVLWLKAERTEQKRQEKAAKKAEKAAPVTVTVTATDIPTRPNADFDEEEYPSLESDTIYAEGDRNNATSRFAYRRWVLEMCSPEELQADVEAFGDTKCTPPLPKPEQETIIRTKMELRQTGSGLIFNGAIRPTNARVGLHGIPLAEPLKGNTVREQMADAEARTMANPDVVIANPDWSLLTKPSALAKPGPSWIDEHVQTASQLSCKPVEWAIHEMILQGSVNILCAEHGAGKSTIADFIAKALITDSGFAGRKTSGKKLRVVYCDRENPEAVVRERLVGIGLIDADGKEVPGFRIWGGWPGAVFDPPAVMNDPRLIEDAKRHTETFYIFDSLSGFIQGEDENDNPTMHKYMSMATALSRLCMGVLILHHTPKRGKELWRGAASIIDKSDHALYMEKKPNGTAVMGAIRFRACAEWENHLKVNFSPTFPDGRLGLYISYATLKSGVSPTSAGASPSEAENAGDRASDAAYEVDLGKSDAELIAEAEKHIREARQNGEALNQGTLAQLLGIESAKVKTRVLCANSPRNPRPWQVKPHGKSILFYILGEKVPSADERAAEKAEKKRTKDAERVKTKRAAQTEQGG
jgi:Bifunctional DNA primase/polymerase, N-terminal/AAA domain